MASRYNFTLEQGTDRTVSLTWKDSEGTAIDLTAYDATMSARVRKTDADPVFTKSEANDITLGANGAITIDFTEAEIDSYDFRYARYDLFMDNGQKRLFLEGEITLRKKS